jgi:SAM-dependent MidA family methyltransferase
MAFYNAGEAMRKANGEYYARKGTDIYEDFGTVVRFCPLLAQADARDFAERKKADNKSFGICDFGIGDGSFAFDFLDELGSVAPSAYAHTQYSLCDISEKMLKDVMASPRAKKHSRILKSVVADASAPPRFSADYVRSNEMYDDLEARIFVMRKGRAYEVLLDASDAKNGVQKKYAECADVPQAMQRALEMCEGRELVHNAGALANLRAGMGALKAGGWIDIYDYGHASPDESMEEPEEVWNEGIVREYGGQLTVDVSFWLLMEEAKRQGFGASVQTVSERLAASFKKRFRFVDMRDGKKAWVGYMDDGEVRAKKAMLMRAGYSEEFFDGEVEETDEYLHLRVEKK